MIGVIDYGVGNVQAFLNVYKRINVPAAAVRTPAEARAAAKLILPGVGHFDHAMRRFDESGLRDTVDDLVQRGGVPVLGVCVGMQMLAAASDEGVLPGLGWIPGRVRALGGWDATARLPLPHMGWNDVQPRPGPGLRLFDALADDSRFYFLHSFFFDCAAPDAVAATARYGADFCAAVSAGNVHGVQFHPEKSHHFGTRLLRNFAAL